MKNTPITIDSPVPVDFKIERNGTVSLSVQDYTTLLQRSKTYTIGCGKHAIEYAFVHTVAAYVALIQENSGPKAIWVSDEFAIKGVFKDAAGNYSFELERDGVVSRLSYDAILPKKIEESLFLKNIAVNTEGRMHEAFSKYLQGMLNKLQAQDAKQILGWKMQGGELTWNGANTDPPLLQYYNSYTTENEYLTHFNALVRDSPELQFVLCAALSSTIMAYLNLVVKIPVNSFGVSLVGSSSTGKTTAQVLAASMYSSPTDEAVFTTFYGTANALTHQLGKHWGVSICYDESTVSNGINKSDFVYAFSIGKSKSRLDTQSQLKERDHWLCSGLFSAESHLVDYENDNAGLSVRIIPLEDLTYSKSSEHADQVKKFAASNYGVVGKILSDWLLNAKSSDVNRLYDDAKDGLAHDKTLVQCHLTDRMLANHAMILCTAKILDEIGIQLDIAKIQKISIDAMNYVAEYADRGKTLVHRIFGYINREYKHLKGIKWCTDAARNPNTMVIVKETMLQIFQGLGVKDSQLAIKDIDKTGCLKRQSKNRLQTKTTIDGVPAWVYQFDMTKVYEQFGSADTEVLEFSNMKQRGYWDRDREEIITYDDDREAVLNGADCKPDSRQHEFEGKLFLLP